MIDMLRAYIIDVAVRVFGGQYSIPFFVLHGWIRSVEVEDDTVVITLAKLIGEKR